jgi:hypothetical protein
MSRDAIPFAVGDISALAQSLKTQLDGAKGKPGHVLLLNMLARGAGFRNFQHLRASAEAEQRLAAPPPPAEPVDQAKLEKLARYFDRDGRLIRWPGKDSHRGTCLWVLWSHIEAKRVYREQEINALLRAHHLFGDHALLRRELFDRAMVTRTPDGREYRRIEARPPAEALALIRLAAARSAP